MSAPRCPRCDREGCPALAKLEHVGDHITFSLWAYQLREGCPACEASRDCHAHEVDWRACALSERAAREQAERALAEERAFADRLHAWLDGLDCGCPRRLTGEYRHRDGCHRAKLLAEHAARRGGDNG